MVKRTRTEIFLAHRGLTHLVPMLSRLQSVIPTAGIQCLVPPAEPESEKRSGTTSLARHCFESNRNGCQRLSIREEAVIISFDNWSLAWELQVLKRGWV